MLKTSKKFIFPLIMSLLLFTACNDSTNAESTSEETKAENQQTIEATKSETTERFQLAKEKEGQSEDENAVPEFRQILLKNPSYEYFLAVTSDISAEPIILTLLSESQNKIIDTKDWFINNNLYMSSISDYHDYGALARYTGNEAFDYEKWREENRICLYDDTYIYTVSSMEDYLDCENAPYMDCLLTIFEKESEVALYQINFSDFCFRSEELRSNNVYTELDINWAQSYENVLYVSLSYNGYAEPNTSFIVAISLETIEIIWKSDSLVCNSYNFLIEGGVLLCGYGFTAEPDYLYQLDLSTGKILDQTKLRTKPDYLVLKEEQLYIRCYNTDYIFEVKD